jgi:hypothetical protein
MKWAWRAFTAARAAFFSQRSTASFFNTLSLRSALFLCIFFSLASAWSDDGTSTAPAAGASTNATLRQVGPGVFELGQVRLEKQSRTVSFPGVVNMTAGLVEYLVVTSSGKTHESVLRTDAAPYQIHLALLLLGAQGAGTNAFPDEPSRPLPGDQVIIEVGWKADGKEKRFRAEQLVQDRQAKAAMRQGPWIYNGSRTLEGMFMAQELGSIISLIEDPDALINNPRLGRENDENWEVRPVDLPAAETPVRVFIRLGTATPAPFGGTGAR